MPRRTRIPTGSGVYHIMMRGIEKKNIFIDDEDKKKILNTIIEKRKLEGFKLYAYCVMDNHLHLVMKEEGETVSQSIKRIGTSYAHYFNKKYSRVGHLFQDRFKSEPIRTDPQLLTAVRYIHRNPVKANIARCVQDYRWSSYSIYTCEISNVNKHQDLELICEDMEDILLRGTDNRKRGLEEFIKLNEEEINCSFIDFDQTDKEIDMIKNRLIVINILNEYGIETNSLTDDHQILGEIFRILKNEHGISLRQIASILAISRSFVQRITSSESKKNCPLLAQ